MILEHLILQQHLQYTYVVPCGIWSHRIEIKRRLYPIGIRKIEAFWEKERRKRFPMDKTSTNQEKFKNRFIFHFSIFCILSSIIVVGLRWFSRTNRWKGKSMNTIYWYWTYKKFWFCPLHHFSVTSTSLSLLFFFFFPLLFRFLLLILISSFFSYWSFFSQPRFGTNTLA